MGKLVWGLHRQAISRQYMTAIVSDILICSLKMRHSD